MSTSWTAWVMCAVAAAPARHAGAADAVAAANVDHVVLLVVAAERRPLAWVLKKGCMLQPSAP